MLLERVFRFWFEISAVLLVVAILWLPSIYDTEIFLHDQDLPILIGILGVIAFVRVAPRVLPGWLARWLNRLAAKVRLLQIKPPTRPLAVALGLAILCGLAAWLGARWIFGDFPLSMDEFMANFDAVGLGRGTPMAPVPAEWRSYVVALQPVFGIHTAGGAFWGSTYLPINAALRALGAVLGAQTLVSPLLATISVVAVFGIARRLWPERPGVALAAAILLATSSQFLVTAMTPYAMNAHLAFNLVWLWLFLRGGRLGHAGAIVVGFLACGLHQFIFHPLFVAPFVLQLWLERRWSAAILYTLSYAAICLFWIDYPQLVLRYLGAAPAVASAGGGTTAAAAHGLTTEVKALLDDFEWSGVGYMSKNLIRFVTWQNLLTAPLALLGAVAAVRARGTLRSLVLGVLLTTLAMFVLMPYQGHGWGYRYFHGLLGSMCLVAAWQWGRLTDQLPVGETSNARIAFLVVAALSAGLLFPIHAWQAHRYARPYMTAGAAIARAPTQVVLVDSVGVHFGADLIRNDPYLARPPFLVAVNLITPAQLTDLCSRYTISTFSRDDAARLGIALYRVRSSKRLGARRLEDLQGRPCGAPAQPVRPLLRGGL